MTPNNIFLGNCIEEMAKMPNKFIDLTVTSPPYDNLRSYNKSLIWNRNIWESIIKELITRRISKDSFLERKDVLE